MKNTVINVLNKVSVLILVLIFCLPFNTAAQIEEYMLKAVFIEKFTRFVEWPAESGIDDTSKPFVIGIIGESRLGSSLEGIFSGKKIRGKRVEVRHIVNPDEASGCHLLFISKVSKKHLSDILSATNNMPILTVSDSKGFADNGVLINFYIRDNKVRFEINETAVRKSRLNFSYLLMQVATIVKKVGWE